MATAKDPICLMQVDTDNPNGGTSEHDGQTYYFCAPGCRIVFERDPEGVGVGTQQAHRHGGAATAAADHRAAPVPSRQVGSVDTCRNWGRVLIPPLLISQMVAPVVRRWRHSSAYTSCRCRRGTGSSARLCAPRAEPEWNVPAKRRPWG